MHRTFRKKLDKAKGVSEFVIALNIDIRGFSDWSLEVDSAQTALFIKKVYAKLIDEYFADAAFFKPTGDGLLVVLNFEEEQVGAAVENVVRAAMAIVDGFESLCADEPVVNFPVPTDVGIGISRGPASRLRSGVLTLDYSGRVLNLASRLMDLARPRGVVFDSQLGFGILDPKLQSEFQSHEVYLRGVAPRTPIEIQCWPSSIEPPAANQSPIGQPHWEHVEHSCLRQDFSYGESFAVILPNHPPDPTTLRCEVVHDRVTPSGRRSKVYDTSFVLPLQYVDAGGRPEAHINEKELLESLEEVGVGPKWPVRIRVSYRSA